jgi:hypothetical protein
MSGTSVPSTDADLKSLPAAVQLAIGAGTFSYGHMFRKFEIQRAFELHGDLVTAEFVHDHCGLNVLLKIKALKQLQTGTSGVRRLLSKEAKSALTDVWVHDKGQAGLCAATLALQREVLGLDPRARSLLVTPDEVTHEVGLPPVSEVDVERNLVAGGRALLRQLAQDGGLTKAPFNLRNQSLATSPQQDAADADGSGNLDWPVKSAIGVLRAMLQKFGLTVTMARRGKQRLRVYSLSVDKKVRRAGLAAGQLTIAERQRQLQQERQDQQDRERQEQERERQDQESQEQHANDIAQHYDQYMEKESKRNRAKASRLRREAKRAHAVSEAAMMHKETLARAGGEMSHWSSDLGLGVSTTNLEFTPTPRIDSIFKPLL